jgi:hypothetical protein
MPFSSLRAQYFCLAAAFSLVACGGKERPPSITDEVPVYRDATVVSPPTFDGSTDAAGADAGGGGGSSGDPAAAEVADYCGRMQPPYDVMFCFGTQKGHPASTAVVRNLDSRNGGIFQFRIDADHRVFDSLGDNRGSEMYLKVAAPMGDLVAGSYSTETGAVLSFTWENGGKCPGAESGTFEVYAMSWDTTQVPNIPDHAEIDFHHHCGDLSTPVLSGRYRLKSNRPP